MRGGHNVKSVIEKKAQGTSRKSRDAGRVEMIVMPVSEIPAPAHFSDRHLEKWNWLCGQLSDKNLLTSADRDAVQIYVETWVIYEDCAENIRENGTVLWIETSAGKKPITNPAYRHMKDSETTLRMIWDHFGMTPRARMGIKAPEKPKTSMILEMMKGRQDKKAV
jgi:P27 family predicted phage terminase small subunit